MPPRPKVLYSLLLALSGQADGKPKPDDVIEIAVDNATLAYYMNCSVSAMRSYLYELVETGIVSMRQQGLGRPNLYRVYYSAVRPASLNGRSYSYRERGKRNAAYQETRRAVLERDGYRCLACGATDNLDVDHIVARSRGGTSDQSNLQVLCDRCNSRKGTKTINYRPDIAGTHSEA